LFGVSDESICKGCFLALLFYQIVFVYTPVYEFETICYVKLTFFVHMQYPRILVSW